MLHLMKSGLLSLAALAFALSVSACSSSSEETPDAAPDGSGGSGKAAEVIQCPTTVTKEIVTNQPSRYEPNAMTVTAGTVVRFKMHPDHNVRSRQNLFSVGYGATECVRFNTVGSYQFDCIAHSFSGTVTVQ